MCFYENTKDRIIMSIDNSCHNYNNFKDYNNEIRYLEECSLLDLYNYRYELYQNKLGFTKYELRNKINCAEFAMILIPGGYYLLNNIKQISHLRALIDSNSIRNKSVINALFEQIILLANNCEIILNLQKNSLLDPEEILHLKFLNFSKFITNIKENIVQCKWLHTPSNNQLLY